MEKALQSKEDSLDYAVARGQLIRRHALPDDPIVGFNDDYWGNLNNGEVIVQALCNF